MRKAITIALLSTCAGTATASAQNVFFSFDNAPPSTSLPVDVTVSGITAHLTATGGGFSIQQAGAFGFTPVGFSGLCIMPNSVSQADLNISFSTSLTDFSILCAVQDLYCDNGATMKVTAYKSGTLVGSNTAVAPPDYYWPTTTLSFHSAIGFNSVNIHYFLPPPGCGDYGSIFMADNMNVTPSPAMPGDLNGDNHVNGADLAVLLGAWGTSNAAADLNDDGTVNGADLAILLGAWTG